MVKLANLAQVTGFTDIAPVVREQTVKAVLTIITKLSDRTINGELLKYLAKTSNDEQPGIRTNTTICLGKIAKHLGANVSFVKVEGSHPADISCIDEAKSVGRSIYAITPRPFRTCSKCCPNSFGRNHGFLSRGRLRL